MSYRAARSSKGATVFLSSPINNGRFVIGTMLIITGERPSMLIFVNGMKSMFTYSEEL